MTSSGGSDGAVNDGSSATGMNCPIVSICTFDDANKIARLTVNGKVFTASYVGTPKVATALELFGLYSSGTPGTGTGTFVAAAVYSVALTTAQEASVSKQIASLCFGAPFTKRYIAIGSDNSLNTATAAESDDGLNWHNARYISLVSKTGQIRDVSFEGKSSGREYYAFTEFNFTNFGGTFGRALSAAIFVWA